MSESKYTPDAGIEWLMGGDTGLSSGAIFAHMTGRCAVRPNVPLDADDFGRCYRLLDRFPEWRARIGEMSTYGSAWSSLAAAWSRLEETYRSYLADEASHPILSDDNWKKFQRVLDKAVRT